MLPGVLQDLFTPLLPAFEEETGIRVQWSLLPFDQLNSKVLTSLQAGVDAYDVVLVSEMWMVNFGRFLEPLEPYIQSASPEWDFDDLISASLVGGQWNGLQVGIPWRDAARILYWNKQLFDEAGLEGPPKTWDELLAAAKALTTDEVWGYALQGQSGQQGAIEFFTMLYSWGGSLLNEDNTRAAFNSEAGVSALEFYVDLIHKHRVAPPDSANWGWDQMITALEQGKVAMTVAYAPYAGLLDDPDRSNVVGQFEFAESPTQVTSASLGAAWQFAIPKSSRNKDAAWKFIEYFTSKSAQLELTKIGNLPVRHSVFNDPELLASRRDFPAARAGLASSVRAPQVAQLAQIEDILGRAVNEALNLQKSPKAALDEAAAQVNELLSFGR